MPLFNLPKKSTINDCLKSDDKISCEEIKTQIKENLPVIENDYAILGSNKLKFYYIIYNRNKKPFKNITHTYLPDNDIFENKILIEMYALKVLLEQLKRENKKEIIIYTNISDLDLIKKYSEINNTGSMFRYKAREILAILENFKIKISFRDINSSEQIKEIVENENRI